MKDIRLIQYEKARDQYQRLIKRDDRNFSLSDILKLRSRIFTNLSERPLSGRYRVDSNQPIDIKSMNAELSLIKTDIESIFDYLGEVSYKQREMEYIIDTYAHFIKEKTRLSNKDIMSLSSGKFVDSLTQELPFDVYIDEIYTTATIADNKLTTPILSSESELFDVKARDISIERIGPDYQVNIEGEPLDIFKQGRTGSLKLTLDPKGSVRYSTAGYKVTLKGKMNQVNYLFIRMNKPEIGIRIKVDIVSDKNHSATIFNTITNSDTIDVPFTTSNLSSIVVEFTMDMPNSSINGQKLYEIILHSIRVMNTIRDTSCEYYTTGIPIENDIDHIQLVKEDDIYGEAGIKYSLTTKLDTDGKPSGFMEVAGDEIFSIKSQKQLIDISPIGNKWNISKTKESGRRLYNILEGIESLEFGSIKVEDEIIKFSEDIEIIQDSIKLYNGIGNYLITDTDNGVEYSTPNIIHIPELNKATGWLDPIPLLFNIRREPIEKVIYNNGNTEIELKNPVNKNSLFYTKLYDYSNTLFENKIINIINNKIIIEGEINTNNKIYADYITTLKMMTGIAGNIDLDVNSVEIYLDDEELIMGKDYNVIPTKDIYSIELLRTGEYNTIFDPDSKSWIEDEEQHGISVKYNFRVYGSVIGRTYNTFISVDRYTDIAILPFTNDEISAGNFHIINGNNVSTEIKYTLSPGWNEIKTSNPYPTKFGNKSDINIYTKKPCYAGIVFPTDYTTIRPYKDSMKQVSPFVLSTLNNETFDSFAYEDGKLYINYLPEYLDPVLIQFDPIYEISSGNRFLCKTAKYDADMKNIAYNSLPESFEIEFKYKTKSEEKIIYVKIDIAVRGTTGSARVLRLGINKFREIE